MSTQPAAPVPLGKDKAKEAIDHVISNVFEFSPVDTHPIRNALIVQTGLEDDLSIYESWLELDEPSIDALQCSAGKGRLAPLSQGYITYVKRFKFMIEECQQDPTWDDINIFALTRLEWRAFSRRYINGQVTTLPVPPPPGTTSTYIVDPVVTFSKSIKRDPKDFPTISDIKDWDKYHRGTQATAKVQDVEPPFDPAYVPSAADKPLFDRQNGYVYKALMDSVQDPSLKAELNKVPVGDGQQGWAAIKKKAEASTAAKNAAQRKMKYLSNVCIDDGSWRGTNKGFLDHWRDTCRICEEYSSFVHLDDALKLDMLKNAVKGAPHLASVEANSDLYQRMGHSTMPVDFDGYFEVLSSAAENYDDKVGSTTRSNTRRVNVHSAYGT